MEALRDVHGPRMLLAQRHAAGRSSTTAAPWTANGEPASARPMARPARASPMTTPFDQVGGSMSRILTLLIAHVVLIGAASVLPAQVTATPDTAKAVKSDSANPLRATVGLSFANSSGNSEFTSFTVNERVEWLRPRFLWSQLINTVEGITDGEETANLFET